MATKDERRERQRRFAMLSAQDRRAIVRSVNRGQPVEQRKHAEHAVHIARRQMRFWRWSWLIGPAVGLVQIGQLGWQVALLNAVVAALALGAMSAFFFLRARRALHANLALLSRRDAARLGEGEGASGPDSHLPRTTPQRGDTGAGSGSPTAERR
ncbi:MAG: hypothetical protein ACLFS9_11400, partial [Nitriliruptoraceae bacterium]